jgi:hypothetical protein
MVGDIYGTEKPCQSKHATRAIVVEYRFRGDSSSGAWPSGPKILAHIGSKSFPLTESGILPKVCQKNQLLFLNKACLFSVLLGT